MHRSALIASTLGALFLGLPALAWSDGFFAPRRRTPEDIAGNVRREYLAEPEQHAFIHFDGQTETLYLQVEFEGNAREFGWVVPVPRRPEVQIAEHDLLRDLAGFEYRLKLEAWKAGRLKTGGTVLQLGGSTKRKSTNPKPKPVTVVERKRLGVYDVAILRASEAGALEQWLDRNGFRLPQEDGSEEILAHYVEADMFFCASRVVVGDAERRKLQPIVLRFASERPFFPLRISRLQGEPTRAAKRPDISVHVFLPVDELSFTGERRLGHPEFSQRERLFRRADLPKSCSTFPTLRKNPYTLVSFTCRDLRRNQMRDLWIATSSHEARAVGAEYRFRTLPSSYEGVVAEGDGLGSVEADARRAYLIDFPDTPWAKEVAESLEQIGGDGPAASARRFLERAEIRSAQGRFEEALDACRYAAHLAPGLESEISARRAELLERESTFLEAELSRLRRLQPKAVETGDFSTLLTGVIDLILLTHDYHSEKSLSRGTAKERYRPLAQLEYDWLLNRYRGAIEPRLKATVDEIEWLTRRDAARAHRGVRMLRLIARDTAVAPALIDLEKRFRRGLR